MIVCIRRLTPMSCESLFNLFQSDKLRYERIRRRGRVVEGAPLLRE